MISLSASSRLARTPSSLPERRGSGHPHPAKYQGGVHEAELAPAGFSPFALKWFCSTL
jgi:hypothetical protein